MAYVIVGLALIFIVVVKVVVFMAIWSLVHGVNQSIKNPRTVYNEANIYYDARAGLWWNPSDRSWYRNEPIVPETVIEAPTQMKLFDPIETR